MTPQAKTGAISLLLIGAAVLSAFSDLSPVKSLKEIFSEINTEVLAHSRAYETLKEATEKIGHRLTGSENGRRAEEYAFTLLKSYGFEEVRYHEFVVEAWARDSVSLTVNTSDGSVRLTPQAITLAHSPIKSEISSSIVDAGNGLRKNFEEIKEKVKGKIVLLNIGIWPKDTSQKNLHRSEKTSLAIEYGAAGVIFVNTVPGNIILTGTASVTGSLIPIPAVCISLEQGDSIRSQLNHHALTASIFMTNKSNKIHARNVIATLKGSVHPEEIILIGGHLDSWDLATGSIDNGIGSFTILEMARTFKALKLSPKRSIKFVMFMGEEQGLLGSKALIRDMIEDGTISKLRYVMNLDMAGNTAGFNLMGRDEMNPFADQIGKRIKETDTTFKNKRSNKPGLHSDHETFMLEGIPVMNTMSNLDTAVFKFYHSNKDDFSLVNKSHMNNCARFCSMMLYALADADSIPAQRLTSAATRDFLIKANLKEALVLGKDWRWD